MPAPTVTVYTSSFCGYCMRVKALLDARGIEYTEINIEDGPELRQQMAARSGRRSVPQVFMGDRHIGGSEELAALARSGELDSLLSGAAA